MQSERWQNCTDIFNAAAEQPREQRAALLDRACNGDAALRNKVELLLKYHDQAGDFIASPAFEIAPEFLLDDADALIGQHLGHYRIEAVLGVGGMGVVYLAHDEQLGRNVALKLLPQSLVSNEVELERLKREARTASALNHPNIVTIHEVGQVDGVHYIATEFIEGTTLRERLAQGPIAPNEALEIAVQVASALSVAHAAGIVHCDIKPENIMLRPDGYVKVLDFGIAKFTQQEALAEARSGGVEGTKRYMSPEQERGDALDARTDIWSLGVTLQEMAAGRRSAELDSVISRALAKDRAARYRNAAELRAELQRLQRKAASVGRTRWRIAAAAFAVLVIVAFVYVKLFSTSRVPSPNEKSIAVLPFADLSPARDQEYFCDGIQEEILTRLARIADLKVISRTSTQRYKDAAKNLPEIARQLGVAHVLEGTVQKTNGQVRVNAQLIDARNDAHLWTQAYDRELADVFAIQSDIAQQIANQLQAKLSPNEEAALRARPTQDMLAYDFYLRAKELERGVSGALPEKLNQKVLLLDQAVARDPDFVPALCLLARAHLEIYWFNLDHTAARLELARNALEAAARLQPDAGEVHLARAIRDYWVRRDYASALAEVAHARRLLPNDVDTLQFLAFIERRQGEWNESIRHLEEARTIDPRNAATIGELAFEYVSLRRYADAARAFEQVLAWNPDDFTVQLGRALVDVEAKADLRRLQSIVFGESAKAGDAALLAAVRIRLPLWQRDYHAAEQALSGYPGPNIAERGYITPREFFTASILRGRGDPANAQTAFLAARERAAAMVAERPDDAKALIILAEIDARLGRKAEAIREGEEASKLLPVSKDAFDGPDILARLAGVLAQVGETRRALDLLEQVTKMPGAPSLTRPCYGRLKIDEVWDSLRGDPRFEKIVASLVPEPSGAGKKASPFSHSSILARPVIRNIFAMGLRRKF
jgi:TolB-like protein/cytochrome c-type biogenesis protein CcmH/NrfG